MKIKSFRGEYEVYFTEDFVATLRERIEPGDWLLVDAKVAELYKEKLEPFRKLYRWVVIQPEESSKSYAAAGNLIRVLIEGGFKRNNRLIAIGGGIVQDAVAFAASIIYRGIQWFFLPTTLLAQGDSCIGSKTSVNFDEYKNMLGGFHPPKQIIIDPGFLQTLDVREVRSGLGEMSHFFLIGGRSDFELVRKLYDSCFHDSSAIQCLTERSLEIKKEMVERDEFDQGPRKIFNYGHTFGHALESITHYQIPHGIAVSYGMDLANCVSVHLGLLDQAVFDEVRQFLKQIWLESRLGEIDIDQYMGLLAKDKKNVGTKLNLILTRGVGDMFLCPVDVNEGLVDCVRECFDYYTSEIAD